MAQLLASAFASVFNVPSGLPQAPHRTHDGALHQVHFSVQDVTRELSSVNPSSAMGPDSVHPALLKHCSNNLAYPLFKIFSLSVNTGELPDIWKRSHVTPIFKKGKRSDPLNYRPVSLTSVSCKILERLIVKELHTYLETNSLLDDNQFGFLPGKSVEDQLLITYDAVTEWMDSGNMVDLILFDFSKAFDTVNHQILFTKLSHLGIDGSILSWIKSFLSYRTMEVVVGGQNSSSFPVISGVPQGSVLGPCLFLIYINHVSSTLISNYKLFADDLKLYLLIKPQSFLSVLQGISVVQKDINSLIEVAESWDLKINVNKTKIMSFGTNLRRTHDLGPYSSYTVKGKPICFSSVAVDLGITVDPSLRFHHHIQNLVSKAAGLSYSLIKSTLCRSPSFMTKLFITHIRPLLEFASSVWNTGYITDLSLLESVQRRWTKLISGCEGMSYDQRLKLLNLYSVKGRLLRADLIKCWKIFNGLSPITPTHLFRMAPALGITRGHKLKILVPHSSCEARHRFFSVRMVKVWNSLPPEVAESSNLNSFKAGLAAFLGDTLFDYH